MIFKKVVLGFISFASIVLLAMGACCYGDDRDHTGEIYAINMPEASARSPLALNKAHQLAGKYRWIYVNASLKDLDEARGEAAKLSGVLGRPLLLVYLPRNIMDSQRNSYPPSFQRSLTVLITSALKDNKQVLVSARSYGVHQALRVVRQFNSPLIMLTGIAPAFGAFGNAFSNNVQEYIYDVQYVQSKYCMIASQEDGFTWRSGGAAFKRRVGYRGDEQVGKAMDKNRGNVYTVKLDDADHTPIDDYIKHGLGLALRQCAYHFNMQGTPIGPSTKDLGDELEAQSLNKSACVKWCRTHDGCDKCSTLLNCGPGYDTLATWKGSGLNWHACGVRESRDQASRNNYEACQRWCKEHKPLCVGCSKLGDCGKDYRDINSWQGRGDNWHACAKRDRDEASSSNRAACEKWCNANKPGCVKCSEKPDCGRDYKDIKSWTGHGDNWYACAKRETREEASKSNHDACEAWCKAHKPGCEFCSEKPDCGRHYKDINSWTGHGDNWYACKRR